MWLKIDDTYVFVIEIKFGKEVIKNDFPRDVVYCKFLSSAFTGPISFITAKITDQDQILLIKHRLFKEE